ncbi:ATP-binding cassette domain-containing protein [Clostridiaceae bacterium M8S5]|nr:ATP-binding cassette domain-containing protein [Clostridiaceae bacterium M8S5]
MKKTIFILCILLQEIIKEIELSNLSYKYLGNTKNSISEVNLVFKANKKYAIIGPSGCGKSTLVKILAKLANEYVGTIKVNSKNLHNLNSYDWRNKISTVQQEVFMFDDTLRYNITLGKTISDNMLLKVLDDVELLDFVNSLPSGLDTHIGDNGNLISGGEKQRIAIARALVKDTEIIIMDEATSALDFSNTNKLNNLILSLNKMIIVITHKYSAEFLKKFDHIIVMENGKVLAQGNYDDIICMGIPYDS